MKTRLSILLLIFTVLVAACQPAAPAQLETPQQPTREAVHSDNETVGEENANADKPRPEIVWNRDPNALIVRGTFCCGFTTPLVPLNYIPDFQIWGDGRYIWVVYNADNTSRQVLEGQLTEEQLTSTLTQVVDAGFFGWEDRYENMMVSDMADKCFTINLESASKTVCEYYEGAPKEFHALYDALAKGNGLKGTEYIPESGYLIAYPYPRDVLRPISEDDILWPSDTLFPLSTAVEQGVWVDGEALEIAWQAVNKDPWSGTVRDSEAFYSLTIQIPGVSMNEPPAETE